MYIKMKEREYKQYVDEHTRNVQTAWENMKNSTVQDYIRSVEESSDSFYVLMQIVNLNISNHDRSKYGPEEWEYYRKEYYPVDAKEKEKNKADYDEAWKHHYTNNLHHWNWWYLNNLTEKMPFAHVIEMCCDWIAMSMKFGGTAWEWYNKQTDIVLGEKQKEWVKNILTKYYGIEVK